jgi:serine/threonine-protein kinase
MAAGGAGTGAVASSEPPAAGLRPAFSGPSGPGDEPVSPAPGTGGGAPPIKTPPGDSGPGGSGPGGPKRPGRVNRRRLLVVAGAVGLLGLATYGWALTAVPDGNENGTGAPEPTVVAASGKCVVSYAVNSDDGERFKATVTVANRDYRAVKNWNLWFIMQGDQVLSGAGKVSLDQQGRTVTVKSSELLSPQKSKTMTITGRYAESNAAPMVFQLGGENCETYVSGKPGAPSQPVQRLSNGAVRLGPPVKDNPVPGISVGPGGVVVPVPLPSGAPSQSATSPAPVQSSTEPAVVLCMDEPDNPDCFGPKPPPRSPSATPTSDPPTSPPPTEPSQDTDPEDTGVGNDGGTGNEPPPTLP